jgi:hypothetical protein
VCSINKFLLGVLILGLASVSSGLLAHGSGTGPSDSPEGVIVTRHFSGLWEQSEHQNQGFTLHVVHQYSGERTAVAFWFTFGEDKEPTWLMGQGPVIDNRIELDLYRVSDVDFLQQKNPDLSFAEIVGSALMEFDTCQTGTVTYNTDLPGMVEGTIPIEQFGWILNTHCSGGMSDDMPVDAVHGHQGLALTSARDGIDGSGHAWFESYPNHVEFEVETKGLPDGEYRLYVGMHDRGGFSVQNGHGEIKFSSPAEDGHMLLNFEPRGQRIEIHDNMGAVLSSFDNIMEEDDHSQYRGSHGSGHGHDDDHDYACDDDSGMGGGHGGGMGGHHGGDDCVEAGDFIEVEVDLENSGVLVEAKGEAEWEMNSHRIKFSVEIEDVPVGHYPLHVGGAEVGIIRTFAMHNGEVFGRISFRDPEVYGIEHLDFDPRGQKIEVLQGTSVILEADFPAE